MFDSLRQNWRRFQSEPPGRRFEARYHRRRRDQSRAIWHRFFVIGAGLLMLVIGIVLVVAPGPATLFFIPGGLLLSSEFLFVARFLDQIDRRSQPWLKKAHRRWSALSPRIRHATLFTATLFSICGIAASIFWVVSRGS